MKRIIYSLISLLFFASVSSAQVAVIANKDVSISSIDQATLTKYFSMGASKWANGKTIVVVDNQGAAKDAFYGHIGMTPKKIKKAWMKKILKGEGKQPAKTSGGADTVSKVASTSGAISFVMQSDVTDAVKTLLVIK